MKLKTVITTFFVFNIWIGASCAETIKVGLEAFPPLIIDESSGYVITLLKEIEKISDLEFKIVLSNYSRVKLLLKTSRIHLMGLTAIDYEKYAYALPLDLSIPSKNDIFSTTPENDRCSF